MRGVEKLNLEPRTSNRAALVAACVLLLAGCAQQSDLVKQEKELTAKIAKTRTDLDQLIGETRARFNQELTALREEELPALRGNVDKGSNRFEAVQRRLDDIESKSTARLNVIEKIQLDQGNLLKSNRDRLQAEMAKQADTLGALAKTVDAKLDAQDKAIVAQAEQLTALNQSLVDLSVKMEADRKLTSQHLAEVNKSVNSVAKALRTVGEAIETREAEQDRRLDETAKALKKVIEVAQARGVEQNRRFDELTKELRKIGESGQARDVEQDHRLDEMAKALRGKGAPAGKAKGGKAAKGGKPASGEGGSPDSGPAKGPGQAAPDPVAAAVVEGNPADGEDKDYDQSLQAFKNGDYNRAQRGFSEFLRRHPDSKLASNAQYWLGECYYGIKDYGEAIEAFDRVKQLYPDSAKVPAALLKKGFAYAALNDRGRASSTLKHVVETYPGSPEAVKAKDKLAQLR